MNGNEAREFVGELARGFRRRQSLAGLLRVIAIGLPLGALALASGLGALGVVAALGVAVLAVQALLAPPRADTDRMARHLDRVAAELEDSAGLILRDENSLQPLQRLQRHRVLSELEKLDRGRVLGPPLRRRSGGEVVVGALIAAAIFALAARFETALPIAGADLSVGVDENASLALSEVEIRIAPPTYTGRPQRRQSGLDVEAAAGSQISWRLRAQPDTEVLLRTGLGEERSFERDGDTLALTLEAEDSLVYRLVAERHGQTVEQTVFSRLEVVADLPPDLSIVQPAERLTLLDPAVTTLVLEVRARDDYGLAGGYLVATLAQGAGERVEFRERRIPLSIPADATEALVSHTLDLRAMGLGPGSELYLHVEVKDSREPKANVGRSATTILRVPGSSAQATDLGQGLPMILPPTYFRSQRQIIIDTQKLIAESPRLSDDETRRRSESLGIDQRALRMRYGALLGEEFVSGQAVDPGDLEAGEADAQHHDEQAELPGENKPAQSVLDLVPADLTHMHDSTEAATYFASDTRTRLKQVLAQMWDAEGRLRTIDPRGALPFELEALELLKDLQHRSRIYVQKVGFDAPPLDPSSRRLTGELDEIATSHRELEQPAAPAVVAAARALLALLDSADVLDLAAAAGEATQLRLAVARLATVEVSALGALEALDLLLDGRPPPPERQDQLEATLWRLVPAPEPLPSPGMATDDPLTRRYLDLLAAEGQP